MLGTGPLQRREGAYLLHWRRERAVYADTIRLGDSPSAEVLHRWVAEREHVVLRAAALERPLTHFELNRLVELHSERVEEYLDSGAGECVLRHPGPAKIVRDALYHFDADRYDLLAWCVMPNHVHVVLSLRAAGELSSILHSWKSFTSKAINKLLGRTGTL